MERKEAIEIVRKLYNESLFMKKDKEAMVTLIPELKESEDERIRKALLAYFGEQCDMSDWNGIYGYEVYDWLEKQGEPQDKGEISDGYHTFNELYYYRMLYNAAFFNMLPKEWVHKSKKHHDGEECFGGGWFIVMANLPTGQISNHYELKDWDLFQIPEKEVADKWDGHTPQEAADRLHKYLLEKQGEKKPDDKVEPKFKVGDWITNGEYTWKVTSIERLDYILQSQNGDTIDDTISHVDEHFNLWTIQDAKDGDVLAIDWCEGEDCWGEIIIFKKYHEKGVEGLFYGPCVEGYGNTIKNGELAWNDENVPYYSQTWTSILRPATKEQRDLLFTKMKEAGYEWDAEKKELRKIEKKPSNEMILLLRTEYEKGRADAIAEMQKPAWSEEDENGFGDALWAIEQARTIAKNESDMGNLWYAERWLKSVKERMIIMENANENRQKKAEEELEATLKSKLDSEFEQGVVIPLREAIKADMIQLHPMDFSAKPDSATAMDRHYRSGEEDGIQWHVDLDSRNAEWIVTATDGKHAFTERFRWAHEPVFGMDVADADRIEEVLDRLIEKCKSASRDA